MFNLAPKKMAGRTLAYAEASKPTSIPWLFCLGMTASLSWLASASSAYAQAAPPGQLGGDWKTGGEANPAPVDFSGRKLPTPPAPETIVNHLAEKMKVAPLPSLSKDQAMGAFGAHEEASGKIVFGSDGSLVAPKQYNIFNFVPKLDPRIRQQLEVASPCGKRAFQLFSGQYGGELDAVSILYACDNECTAIHEIHIREEGTGTQKMKAVSTPTLLPRAFCDALWGGIVKYTVVGAE